MLVFSKTWTMDFDAPSGSKIEILHDGFGGFHVQPYMSPEERELHRKKKRLDALKKEMNELEKELG